jgi:hypothetical protein
MGKALSRHRIGQSEMPGEASGIARTSDLYPIALSAPFSRKGIRRYFYF